MEHGSLDGEKGQSCIGQEQEYLASKELFYQTLLQVFDKKLVAYVERLYQIKELLPLSEIISAGENQLHHTLCMLEKAASISNSILDVLQITREELVDAAIFHDVGKGKEVDDRFFSFSMVCKGRVPTYLCRYQGMNRAEWTVPFHTHIEASCRIAEKHRCSQKVLEAIAMHHHVKIQLSTLNLVCDDLSINSVICSDVNNYKPAQYAIPGGNLAQVVAIFDQLCAIIRKIKGYNCLGPGAQRLEYEVVRDLVIGVTDKDDPRLDVLGVSLTGKEAAILFDLRDFGSYVKKHTEYEVQNIKVSVLQLIRSLVRGELANDRGYDLVALIGGDEYAVITKVEQPAVLDKMVDRIAIAIKLKTGFLVRTGYGTGSTIDKNYHQARIQAEQSR